MERHHFTSLLLFGLLACLGCGQALAQGHYKLVKTTVVKDGGRYVFEQGGYVMTNNIKSNVLKTEEADVTAELTGSESYVWELEGSDASSRYKIRNVSRSSTPYLSNDGLKLVWTASSKATLWTFSLEEATETFVIKSVKSENDWRFLGYNSNGSHEYKAYDHGDYDDTTPYSISVYELVDVATGITDCPTAERSAEAPCFNLAGQRLARPFRGLCIRNGRKVLCQ